MTAYEFVTHLERALDYARSRGREPFEPVAWFAAPGKFWGSVAIRPKIIGRTHDGLKRYQFTMNQAERTVDILRGRD
jgi:hypothetical protein